MLGRTWSTARTASSVYVRQSFPSAWASARASLMAFSSSRSKGDLYEPDDPEPDDQPIMAATKPATVSTTKSVIGMCATVL